ncbi:MAG TPA: Rieske (2Fe-2S) protein [Streptosporangiaceae bacterium]|nr:Rieske (2Fe-2S) protein [Streptosporangiaceae bacterium]
MTPPLARFFGRGTRTVRSRGRAGAARLRPAEAAERLERLRGLDGVGRTLAGALRRRLPPGPAADVLHGVPLGQPAHPGLSGMSLGFWTSAALLDLIPHSERAARALIAAGVASTAPATLTGLADWSVLHTEQQRVGMAHAAASAAASAFFCASLVARSAGHPRGGKALSFTGLAVAGLGGYLGGHLSFRLAAGANHAESVAHLAPLGWHDLCRLAELPDGRPVRRELGYINLLVLRDGSSVSALADRCAHLGGPLHQGELVTSSGHRCVRCPWHGSTFRISDGSVRRGPATARQPAFETRVSDGGIVQVRPRS